MLAEALEKRLGGDFQSWIDIPGSDEAATKAVQMALSTEPLYKYDPAKIKQQFEEQVAAPMRYDFENYALPQIKESMRFGALQSTAVGNVVARTLGSMYTNWGAELSRRQQAGELQGAASQESKLNQALSTSMALYGENPAIKEGLAYLGTPMTENIVYPGQASGMGQLAGAAMGGILSGGTGTGSVLGSIGGLFGGGAGGAAAAGGAGLFAGMGASLGAGALAGFGGAAGVAAAAPVAAAGASAGLASAAAFLPFLAF
jgi:hypothetical protein